MLGRVVVTSAHKFGGSPGIGFPGSADKLARGIRIEPLQKVEDVVLPDDVRLEGKHAGRRGAAAHFVKQVWMSVPDCTRAKTRCRVQ